MRLGMAHWAMMGLGLSQRRRAYMCRQDTVSNDEVKMAKDAEGEVELSGSASSLAPASLSSTSCRWCDIDGAETMSLTDDTCRVFRGGERQREG